MSSANTTDQIRQLLDKLHWTEEDKRWLLQYLNTTDKAELWQLMQEKFDKDAAINQQNAKAEQLLLLIHEKIETGKPKEKPSWLRGGKRMLVAASIVLVISMSVIAYLYTRPEKNNPVVVVNQPMTSGDIAPGRNAAVLTLSDGSNIVLDGAANGTLARQGNMKVLKFSGKIAYSGKTAISNEVVYNTVTTSRGNQYQLILADGSSVWLNAASSIRFPTAFTARERRVEITGEAYFEVAPLWVKGQKIPFIVNVKTTLGERYEVKVLGTHFNINAYDDEPTICTTLSEGKVKIDNGGHTVLLQPSQQAILNRSSEQLEVQPANVEEALAWKAGTFEFKDASLQSIMRQLSRWYNVDVTFAGPVSTKLYNGSIRRQATLSQVLKILELAGVNYSIEGRTVTIGINRKNG